ncbi:hypothetical protein ACLI4Z_10060 [Natrialbaceae archaeon A-arb3/5]
MSDSPAIGADSSDEYSIAPFLERSQRESDDPIEIAISISGTAPIEDNELDVFLERSRVDPGDRLELGLFVSGTGHVDENDLSVFYGNDELIDVTDPGTVRRTLETDAVATEERAVETGSRFESDRSPDRPLQWHPIDATERDDPAYILAIQTRDAAPPGTYSVSIVFTYRSENGIRQVKRVPRIRVNSWRERREPWLTRGAIALGVLVTLGLLLRWLPIASV